MLVCPMCQKEIAEPAPTCPRCQADLSLLVNFVSDLKSLLDKADSHRRAGEIAPAVQAYLEVLEVDPTNAEALETLGPVLRAVRTTERVGRPQQRMSAGVVFLLMVGIVASAFCAGVAWGTGRW